MTIAEWHATEHPEYAGKGLSVRARAFATILAEFLATFEGEYQEFMLVQAELEEDNARRASDRHVEFEAVVEDDVEFEAVVQDDSLLQESDAQRTTEDNRDRDSNSW